MTTATYDNYARHIGSSEIQKYENPGIIGNTQLAVGYLWSENGLKNTSVKFLESSKENIKITICINTALTTFGAILGGTLAFVPYIFTGGLIGIGINNVQETIASVNNSNDYRIWKGERVQQKVSEVFAYFLCEDPVLSNFLCLKKQTIPQIPVRGPDRQLYEKNEILEWIRNKPAGNKAGLYIDFTEDELIFDKHSFVEIIKRIKILVEKELDRMDLEPNDVRIIKDGLMAYKCAKDKFNMNLLETLLKQSQDKFEALKNEPDRRGRDVWRKFEQLDDMYLKERKEIMDSFIPYKLHIEDNGK